MGLTASYNDAIMFENSATLGNMPEISPHAFCLFAFDNADFNAADTLIPSVESSVSVREQLNKARAAFLKDSGVIDPKDPRVLAAVGTPLFTDVLEKVWRLCWPICDA